MLAPYLPSKNLHFLDIFRPALWLHKGALEILHLDYELRPTCTYQIEFASKYIQ